MPKFGKVSQERKASCHPALQEVLDDAIKYYDFTILCGHRGMEEQNRAFREGNSKLKWPDSKHNKYPSNAVDIAPFPIDWNNIERFKELAIVIKTSAKKLGIKLSWGGDWERFKDYPHWELV